MDSQIWALPGCAALLASGTAYAGMQAIRDADLEPTPQLASPTASLAALGDPRGAVVADRFVRPVEIEGGAVRVDPAPSDMAAQVGADEARIKYASSEMRWGTGTDDAFGFGLVTMRPDPVTGFPLGDVFPAQKFVRRPAWVGFFLRVERERGIDCATTPGPSPSPSPSWIRITPAGSPYDVFVLDADTGLHAAAYWYVGFIDREPGYTTCDKYRRGTKTVSQWIAEPWRVKERYPDGRIVVGATHRHCRQHSVGSHLALYDEPGPLRFPPVGPHGIPVDSPERLEGAIADFVLLPYEPATCPRGTGEFDPIRFAGPITPAPVGPYTLNAHCLPEGPCALPERGDTDRRLWRTAAAGTHRHAQWGSETCPGGGGPGGGGPGAAG